jgi:hypothetical protein
MSKTADFNLDEWIAGVRATERSVEIYQRGDLVAVADRLLAQYEAAVQARAADRSAGDDTAEAILEQIEDCQRRLSASRTWWTVKALSPETVGQVTDAARAGQDEGEAPDLNLHFLAAAVVRVTDDAGDVLAEKVTVNQLKALRTELGNGQILRLVHALEEAMSKEPQVAAPFSRKS